jgi:GH18 family chitinase
MATNNANFIKKHELDGVDIDWEYPGAPDIPGIPAASKDDGGNYLAFLVILKNLLAGKSVSIAAPSSYWYLKQFPIKNIGNVVDYIVYMQAMAFHRKAVTLVTACGVKSTLQRRSSLWP